MMLMKHLDMKKRNDERRKNIEKMRIEKEKEKERRNETKRLELEILTEMKKPVEDMALPDSKPLPDLARIEKLKLSGEAFANILMVFEFLHNFGETLGFDMESLPTMTSFQAALLNEDTESEEELLSIMSHLVVCAIEDPGVPMPLKTLTILGQNLRQADITNTNLSEILRIFIQARAMAEVKLFHGILPPEPKDRKEAIQDLFINADENYLKLLEENNTFKLSLNLKQKTFLCLNPTVKSEIVAFLCNELLSNKAVVNQIEVTMENTHVMKRKKLVLENKVKKLRILHNRKYKIKTELGKLAEDSSTNLSGVSCNDSESHSEIGEDKDDSMSVMSESNCDTPNSKTKGKKKNRKGIRGKRKLDEEMGDENVEEENHSDTDLSDIDDEKEEDVSSTLWYELNINCVVTGGGRDALGRGSSEEDREADQAVAEEERGLHLREQHAACQRPRPGPVPAAVLAPGPRWRDIRGGARVRGAVEAADPRTDRGRVPAAGRLAVRGAEEGRGQVPVAPGQEAEAGGRGGEGRGQGGEHGRDQHTRPRQQAPALGDGGRPVQARGGHPRHAQDGGEARVQISSQNYSKRQPPEHAQSLDLLQHVDVSDGL